MHFCTSPCPGVNAGCNSCTQVPGVTQLNSTQLKCIDIALEHVRMPSMSSYSTLHYARSPSSTSWIGKPGSRSTCLKYLTECSDKDAVRLRRSQANAGFCTTSLKACAEAAPCGALRPMRSGQSLRGRLRAARSLRWHLRSPWKLLPGGHLDCERAVPCGLFLRWRGCRQAYVASCAFRGCF